MSRKFGSSAVLLSFLTLAGCAASAPSIARHAEPFPRTVALLPMDNLSVDMRGPELVRELLDTYLSAAGFDLPEAGALDRKLASIGIVDGGQLNAVTPQKLGELLGAEALLYGELTEFNNANVGIYASRTVEAKLRLVDARTGGTLWEKARRKANSKLGLSKDAAVKNLKTGYAEKALETIMNNPLRPEAEEVARLLVRDLVKTRKNWQ